MEIFGVPESFTSGIGAIFKVSQESSECRMKTVSPGKPVDELGYSKLSRQVVLPCKACASNALEWRILVGKEGRILQLDNHLRGGSMVLCSRGGLLGVRTKSHID